MTEPGKRFKHYDPSVAQGLMDSHDREKLGGLPRFLGVKIRRSAPIF